MKEHGLSGGLVSIQSSGTQDYMFYAGKIQKTF